MIKCLFSTVNKLLLLPLPLPLPLPIPIPLPLPLPLPLPVPLGLSRVQLSSACKHTSDSTRLQINWTVIGCLEATWHMTSNSKTISRLQFHITMTWATVAWNWTLKKNAEMSYPFLLFHFELAELQSPHRFLMLSVPSVFCSVVSYRRHCPRYL